MSTSVLLVDDSEAMLRCYMRALRGAGVETQVATTAGDAVELARIHQPAVVVVDNLLPDGRGVERLGDLRDAAPGAVLMMATAFVDGVDRREAYALGAVAVLDKRDPHQLLELVVLFVTVASVRGRPPPTQ